MTTKEQASPELEQLAGELATAKRMEAEAKEARIKAEEAIAALVETGENGSKTVSAGAGLKVTVKRSLIIKADVDGIRTLDLPEGVVPLRMTDPQPAGYEFDKKAYENIVENHPDVAAKLASFVTVVPAKVSVTLKIA